MDCNIDFIDVITSLSLSLVPSTYNIQLSQYTYEADLRSSTGNTKRAATWEESCCRLSDWFLRFSSQQRSNKMAEANRKKKTESGDLLKQEDAIRAIIIADSFNSRFQPLTEAKPRVLLPLVNRPLLDYILESLCVAGVQEAYVFCCYQGQQIKDHIQNSKWFSSASGISVTTVVSETFLSMGDILRELDGQGLMRSDFILISGDVICNLPLLQILDEHKKRRQKDKGAVMTLVFRTALPGHHSRSLEDEAVICVDAETDKVLYYQKVGGQKKIKFPLSMFQDHKTVTIRHDLLDCHLCICSPQVPLLYSDNFDYQTRDDLVRGVLINEEILGNSIYLHCAQNGFAAKVSNFYMYDAVSQDIIRRWIYPVVPDVLELNGGRYSHLRHNVYKQKDVDLAKGCILEKNIVIGYGTKVGSDTRIVNSVIGQYCEIGNNVTIINSYLWDNVKVSDGCDISTSILANEVELKSKVTISSGCVLAPQVVIGPNITLPEGTLLHSNVSSNISEFGDDGNTEAKLDPSLVGSEGFGYRYEAPASSDTEDEEILDIWGQPCHSEEEESDATSSVLDDFSAPGSPVPDDTNLFYTEVLDSLQRGVEEKVNSENLVLEINSSKYAYNVTMKEVNTLLVKAILELPHQKAQVLSYQEYFAKLKPLLIQLLPLLKNYIKSEESQMDCLISLEIYSICNELFRQILMKVLHILYEKDILTEEVILKWYQKPQVLTEHDPAQQKEVRKQVEAFIKWLMEAEEESSEDSS